MTSLTKSKKRYALSLLFGLLLSVLITGLYANPVKEKIRISGEAVGRGLLFCLRMTPEFWLSVKQNNGLTPELWWRSL